MTNIWGFLSQTIYVSSMAVLILLIKLLMKDKLPARWQYGIWAVLLLCLLTPVGTMGGYIIPQLHILCEALKTVVESNLVSAFTKAETAVCNLHPLPVVTKMPTSITDVLFVIYTIGVIVYIVKYIFEYIKLGKIISATSDANADIQLTVDDVAMRYNLPDCKAKEIKGLPSAFVFGLFRPVLVLPKNIATDEKVILHELMHLKHKDLWQNVFWSVMKALHWPNPFMIYIFRTINNDMESLRDYRVMELLQGEQRRDYGRILLSMTNDKYPSAFGTTSISNGGYFISQRIQAIARFKLYPKGMEMVALCIIALLIPLTIKGNEMTHFPQGSYSHNPYTFTYQYQHAGARLTACPTVSGAIDTYAKAVLTGNELYYLAIQPENVTVKDWYLPEEIQTDGNSELYHVVDLQKVNSRCYVANLLFTDYKTNLEEADGSRKLGSTKITVPIKIIKENGWKVYQTGDAVSNLSVHLAGETEYTTIDVDGYQLGGRYQYDTNDGVIEIIVHKVYTVKNSRVETGFMFSQTVHNLIPVPDIRFSDGYYAVDVEYKPDNWDNVEKVSISAATLKKMSDTGHRSGTSGEGGWSRGTDSRSVRQNFTLWRMKQEMERMTATDNSRFTDIQKQAIARTMSRTALNFGELKFTKENFATIKKTKGIHIRVTVNGLNVCNRKINLKEGKLYDQNIQ